MTKSPDAPPRAPSPKRLSATRAACESRAIGFPLDLRGRILPRSITRFDMNPRLIPVRNAARFMTNRSENQPSRRLACAGCGTEFSCSLSGPCWCSDEDFRMPMPLGRQRLPVPGLPAQAAARAASAACDVTGRWNVGAVLLDMDGTLLDTERVYFDSLVARAQRAWLYRRRRRRCASAMVGLPGPECEAMLHARYGESFPLRGDQQGFRHARPR